jgi:type I restriction enzyme S subunit
MSRRLKSLATLVVDLRDQGVLPYIALEHLAGGTGALEPGIELPIRNGGDTGVSTVRPGDVLFGKLRPYLAKTLLIREPAYASTELLALRPGQSVEARYFGYLVGSRPLIEWATASSDGTKMPRTSWERLGEFRLGSLPGLDIQRAIADYLDRETTRIDALITKKQGMIELLEERNGARRGAVIQSVSMGSTCSLRWLLSEAIADGPHETPEFVDNGVPFLSVDSIVDSRIRFDGCRMIGEEDHVRYCRKLMPRYGDVLITKAASVGKVALVDDKRIFNVWSPIAVLRPDQSVLLPEFLWQYLRSPKAQRDLSLGSTSNTQQNISMRDLGSLRIPIVSIEDQRAVCDLLRKDTQGLVKEIEASVVLLHERRQALITAAVTGELEVSGVAA